MILQVNLQEQLSLSSSNRSKVPILQALFFRWEHFENNIFIQYFWLYSLLRPFLWKIGIFWLNFIKNFIFFDYFKELLIKISSGLYVAYIWVDFDFGVISVVSFVLIVIIVSNTQTIISSTSSWIEEYHIF